jgi:transcriptional regulator with XRE-family HTH domain
MILYKGGLSADGSEDRESIGSFRDMEEQEKQPNEKLRREREIRGWSQQKVAELIGTSNQAVNRWENGQHKPGRYFQTLLCELFGKNAEELGFMQKPEATHEKKEGGFLALPSAPILLPGQRHDPLFDYVNAEARQAQSEQVPSAPLGASKSGHGSHHRWIVEPKSEQESFFVPDRTALLWLSDQRHLGTDPRFAAWPPLLQESHEELATTQELLYISLEVEIMTMALQWKRPSDSILLLQQLTYDTIKKYDAMHKDHSNRNDRVTRRHALQAIAMFPIQMYSLTDLISEMRPLPLHHVLPSCATGITACWELRQYESDGLLTIQHILSAYLPILEPVARQSSSYQSAAAYLASQGYLLVNVLAEHYGKPDLMEAASRQARFYGQCAQDVNLEVSALIRLAIKFDYEHNDVKALETYQEALALPAFSTVSPLLQGRVYAGLAGTHAYCSQSAQALSFLSRAKEIYPDEPESDLTYPFAICDTNTLALWEGLTLKHLANYADAFSAFTRFGKLTPLPGLLELNRIEHLNYAASVAIRQRDLDAATLYLEAAEDVAWQIQDATRLSEVRDSLRSMRLLWPDEAKVKTLQEKLSTRQSHHTL